MTLLVLDRFEEDFRTLRNLGFRSDDVEAADGP